MKKFKTKDRDVCQIKSYVDDGNETSLMISKDTFWSKNTSTTNFVQQAITVIW